MYTHPTSSDDVNRLLNYGSEIDTLEYMLKKIPICNHNLSCCDVINQIDKCHYSVLIA